MVSTAKKLQTSVELIEIPKEDIKWSTVSLSDVITRGIRLEASSFNLDRKYALKQLETSKYDVVKLSEEGGLQDCFYGPRSKRNYLSNIDSSSIGFLGSAEMLDISPKPVKFVSPNNPMAKNLKLDYGMILVSRSGTIGNVTFVNNTLKKYLVSEHAIRLVVKEYPGYIYAYLKTEIAQNLLHSEKFGSVILEIEPESFENMLIPNPPNNLKEKIHDLIISSYDKRDKSNDLIDKATNLLIKELELPSMDMLREEAYGSNAEIESFSMRLSELNGRLEANYHSKIQQEILYHISEKANIIHLDNKNIIDRIILPGRFKRTYVEPGNGQVFLGGKEIGQLNPSNKKYLSLVHHSERIKKELSLEHNMILVTCSGTIGRVAIVPKHWEKWTVNQHVMRIEAKEPYIGLIYTWLNSVYGEFLIKSKTYGSVVNEINDNHLGEVIIPILYDEKILMEISNLVMEANDLRYLAYKEEKMAIYIMNHEVLGL